MPVPVVASGLTPTTRSTAQRSTTWSDLFHPRPSGICLPCSVFRRNPKIFYISYPIYIRKNMPASALPVPKFSTPLYIGRYIWQLRPLVLAFSSRIHDWNAYQRNSLIVDAFRNSKQYQAEKCMGGENTRAHNSGGRIETRSVVYLVVIT